MKPFFPPLFKTVISTGFFLITLTACPLFGQPCTPPVTCEQPNPASCQDLTVQLDNNGNVTITPEEIYAGSMLGNILCLDKDTFTCADVGDNTVILMIDDMEMPTCCTSIVTLLPAILNSPTVADTTVCFDTPATLMATTGGANGDFFWYTDPEGTMDEVMENPLVTEDLTGQTLFWVKEVNESCMSDLVPVTVDVISIAPPSASADPETICSGSSVTLNAVTGGAGGEFSWFLDNNVSVPAFETGATITIDLLMQDTSFWVREESQSCNSDLVEVMVNVEEQPEEPMVNASPVCVGEPAILLASSGTIGGTYEWFADDAGAQLLFTGNPYPTLPLMTDTIFWVKQSLGNCESAFVEVPVTVNLLPTSLTTDAPITICSGADTTITATVEEGSSVEWYADAGGNQFLTSSVTLVTGPLTSATSFWVREIDGNNCVSNLVEAMVLIAPPLADPQTFSEMVCSGDSALLTVTTGGANGSFIWFSDAQGTPPPVGTGPMFNTGPLTVNTSFWVQETDGSCFSDLVKVDVIVMSNPAKPTAVGDSVCSGSPGTLLATTGGGNGTFTWYADSLGTMLVSNSNPFTTPVLNSDTTFWVQESVGACFSELTSATVAITALPPNPTVENDTICAGSDAVLTASNAGGTTEWYNDASGNDLLGTDNPLTISGLTASTSLWVRENNGPCQSDLIKVDIVVNPVPDDPVGVGTTICQASAAELTAFNTIGTIFWSSDAAISDTLNMGNNFTTPALDSTTTYYIMETAQGCNSGVVAVTVTVEPLPPALAPASTPDPVCAGENVLLSALTVENGIYSWTGPENFTSSVQTPELLNVAEANEGWYYVSVTVNGCTSATPDSTQVVVDALPELDAGGIGTIPEGNAFCEGETIGLTAPDVSGLSYIWTYPDGTVSSSGDPNRTIDNADEAIHQGFYTLQVQSDDTGCLSEVYSILVMVYSVPTSISASNDGPVCEGENVQLEASNFLSATYSWTGPNNFADTLPNPFLQEVTPVFSGLYIVTITTQDGCEIEQIASTAVVVNPLPEPVASADIIDPIQDVPVQLDASGGISYEWGASPYLSSLGISSPVAAGMPIGENTFTVTAYNEFGCSAQDSVTINVEAQTVLEIFDLFTPNNDGVNDTWVINYLENIGDYTLMVWDRGGYKILETTSYSNDWNGTYKNNAVPDGTYWYSIRTADTEYKGAVTLKR